MASIRQRGPATFLVQVSCGYDRDGKKIEKTKTFKLDPAMSKTQMQNEAKRLAAIFENEVKGGNYKDTRATFAELADEWVKVYGKANLEETTLHGYEGELRTKILPAIGHIKLKELTPLHLMRFYKNLTEDGVRLDGKPGGYSTRMIRYQHSIISVILQTAVYWQIIDENVARKVQPPKGAWKQKKENYLDESTTQSFLEYVLKNEPVLYQALANVTVFGGLRKGEALALTWPCILYGDGKIRIEKSIARVGKKTIVKSPKNKASVRTISVPPIVMQVFKKLQASSEAEFVFPMDYSTPSRWFSRIKKKFNKEHQDKIPESMSFHGLRHTSATLLIAQGLDVRSLAARLGHADMSTTMRSYVHELASRYRTASDLLQESLGIRL